MHREVLPFTGRWALDQENVLLDYISQVYFSRYYPSGMQQTFTTGAGLLVTYPYFSFGVLTDSLFGYDSETNEITYDLQSMVDELSVGFAFSSEKYDSDVQLSRYVVTTSFDFTDIGDEEHRAIRFGGELKVQFLNDLFIAIQAGYSESRPLPSPTSVLTGGNYHLRSGCTLSGYSVFLSFPGSGSLVLFRLR